MWFALIAIGYWFRGPNFAWYWPWDNWLMHKPPDPRTWSVFGPKDVAALPTWLGLLVIGGVFAGAMVLPKLIKKELPLGKTFAIAAGVLVAIAAIGAVAGGMTALQGFFLVAFGAMLFFFGFQLPQKHIRDLDWVRFAVTMFFVVCTMSVILKMGARLGFNIKYLLTIPDFSLNI
jgi:hypothetical protein